MSWGPRAVLCCFLVGCAGADRIDPSQLELRDVLGLSPDLAIGWDADQRASARHVLEAGMRDARSVPIVAPVRRDLAVERSLASGLAAADAERAKQHQAALGIVELAVAPDRVQATSRTSTLAPHPTAATELRLAGWDRPGWAELPARGLDVLATIATDAGHRGGPVLVTPAAQLAVIAGYVPATPASPARLVVNPVLLAALEPGGAPAGSARVVPDDPIGNPYTFYSSIAACASAQQRRCDTCLPTGTCSPLAGTGDGNAECTQLAANDGRGYALACINFALAIDSVASCTASGAPACPMETRAASSLSTLDANADFLDQATCAGALDQCLGEIFGNAPSSTTTTPPPTPDSSPGCSSSACDAAPDCSGADCSDSGGSSSCDSSSSDSSSSSCDSGDSSGCSGDSGGDCSSGGDSGCSSSGDSGCSGDSGGDCSSGGGNDCSASRPRGPDDRSLLWACLPLPFAIFARRRAAKRARQERAS